MAAVGFMAVAGLVLGAQFLHANNLDRTLPQRKKLPFWLNFPRPSMEGRRLALYFNPCVCTLLAVSLITVAFQQDRDPLPTRENAEMVASLGLVMSMCAMLDVVYAWRVKRWFRNGEPPIA